MMYGVIDDTARVRGFYCASIFCVEFHPYAPQERRQAVRTRWVPLALQTPQTAAQRRLRGILRVLGIHTS